MTSPGPLPKSFLGNYFIQTHKNQEEWSKWLGIWTIYRWEFELLLKNFFWKICIFSHMSATPHVKYHQISEFQIFEKKRISEKKQKRTQ